MGLLFNPLNGELEMGQVASQVPFDNTIFDSYGVTPATQVQEAVDSLITAMVTVFGEVYAYIPTDHDQLSGLADDDHTQYALLAGRSGGQTLSGSSVEDEHLTLKANAAAFNTFTNTGRIKITDQIQNDGGFTISHNNSGVFNEWYYYGHRHTGTITVQSGGNIGTYASVYNDATIVWSGAQILSSIQLFDARPTLEPTISSNVTDTTTNYRMFFGLPQLKPSISTASTWTGTEYGVYVAAPQVGIKTGSHASAAVVMPRMYSFSSTGAAVGAQTTVTDFSHFLVRNVTNAGTITRQIGLDVEALTGGTTDIGVRLAKADTYTLQLSDTGGTAAGGITFGTGATVATLYRSAADTLKTDDSFVCADINTGNGAVELAAGTYTPTATGVANVTSVTPTVCQYMRVGNTVTVSGQVAVTPTSNNTETTFALSLPIASNFANSNECGGSGYTMANSTNGHGVSVYADATNNRAELDYYETHSSPDTLCFTFTYQII